MQQADQNSPATVEETMAVALTTTRSAQALLDEILAVVVADNPGMHLAAGLLLEIKAQQKMVKCAKDAALAPFKRAVAQISSVFVAPTSLLSTGEAHLKNQIQAYRGSAAEQHTRMLSTAETIEDVAAAVEVLPDRPDGLSERAQWRWSVGNAADIPREYYILDTQRIDREVRTLKGALQIPGIQVIRDTILVAKPGRKAP